jgi:hypothetical protein
VSMSALYRIRPWQLLLPTKLENINFCISNVFFWITHEKEILQMTIYHHCIFVRKLWGVSYKH